MSDSTKNLKIAIVANTTWNIYNFRMNVLAAFTKEAYKIYVIAPIDEYIKYRESFPDIIHIPLKKLKRKSTNPFHDISLFIELFNIYKKLKPDVILHYTIKPNIYGGLASRLLGLKSFAFVTGLGYSFINEGILKNLSKFLYKISFPAHRKVIFENQDDLALFKEEKLIRDEQGVSVKGCGVDTNYFSPISRNKSEKLLFTFAGRLLKDKGIKEFIEAAREIKKKYNEVTFQLLGGLDEENPAGITSSELQLWIDDKSIEYIGYQESIKEYISISDCIILPSYREGMPKTLLESCSLAIPIITTDVPGCREVVDHGINGFLVEVRSSRSLFEAIEKFISLDEVQRLEMGNAGRLKALKEFDSEIIAQQILNITKIY